MKPKVEYRVRFVIDEEAQFEECNGEARSLTEAEYAENPYMEVGRPIPYAEYLTYYGNPDRHVYLGVVVDKKCPCCQSWNMDVTAVWGVDLMDDDPGLKQINPYRRNGHVATVKEALALPGYLSEIARDELLETGALSDVANT